MTNTNTLTVYLGSSGHARPVFKAAAKELGELIGKSDNYNLVYGGMNAGLMGILAQSALSEGGHVTGIIPRKILDHERMLGGLNETIMVDDLCDRKKRMFLMADAVISLPGGYGTIDEALEIIYWSNLGLHNKLSVLINIENYWDPLIAYIKTLPDYDPRSLIIVDSASEALPAIENWKPIEREITPHDHYPHFEDEIDRDTNEPIIFDKANIESSYMAICALGLKQLGKHKRDIGFLNTDGQFDHLIEWIKRAAEEKFITPKCLKLFEVDNDRAALIEKMATSKDIHIDLHKEKWGKAEV